MSASFGDSHYLESPGNNPYRTGRLYRFVVLSTLLHSVSSFLLAVSFSLMSPDEVLKKATSCLVRKRGKGEKRRFPFLFLHFRIRQLVDFFQPLLGDNKKEIAYTMTEKNEAL